MADTNSTLLAAFRSVAGGGARSVADVRVHSKEALQPGTDWSGLFGGRDDVVGLVAGPHMVHCHTVHTLH